jgi:hypothetical protein
MMAYVCIYAFMYIRMYIRIDDGLRMYMWPDDGLEKEAKTVVTYKLHLVNKTIYSQVVFDSLYLSL